MLQFGTSFQHKRLTLQLKKPKLRITIRGTKVKKKKKKEKENTSFCLYTLWKIIEIFKHALFSFTSTI